MSATDWFGYTALALVLAMVPTGIALGIDRRMVDGDRVWAKPLKFELSLAIHFATLAWLAGYLPANDQDDGLLRSTAIAAAVSTFFEMAYMAVQAARQRRSHFNVDTPTEALLYFFMALGAVVITLAAAVVGLLLLSFDTPAMGSGLKMGGGLGLVLGAILTVVTAFRMGGAMSRYNGEEKPGGRRMPLTGWSLTVADRRIPHFFATHLMQALPLAGVANDAILPSWVAMWMIVIMGGLYTLFTLQLFQRINRGQVVSWSKWLMI